MKKIKQFKWFSRVMSDELLTEIGNALNDGFEVFKFDIQWVTEIQPTGDIIHKSVLVCILVEYESQGNEVK